MIRGPLVLHIALQTAQPPSHPPPTQGLLFSVLWRMGQDFYNKLEADKSK